MDLVGSFSGAVALQTSTFPLELGTGTTGRVNVLLNLGQETGLSPYMLVQLLVSKPLPLKTCLRDF